jgi:hypothetical protein
MKKLKFIDLLVVVMTFIMVSCNNNQNKEVNNHCLSSYEFIGLDTVNVIDCHGKQGKWVPSISNKLQDTIYYRNDTIIEK